MAVKKAVHKEKIEKFLKCKLSKKELIAAGEEFATALDELDQLEQDLADIKAACKAKEQEVDVKTRLFQGTEKEVDCEIITDTDKKTYEIVRLDTKEVIESRSMTPEELQGQLFDK